MPRNAYKFTLRRKTKFLKLLREDGMGRQKAIEEVGLTRTTLYRHMEADPLFQVAVEDAEMEARDRKTDEVKDALHEAATSGNVMAIRLYLERYEGPPTQRIEVTGRDGEPILIEDVSILDDLTEEQATEAVRAIEEAERILRSQTAP